MKGSNRRSQGEHIFSVLRRESWFKGLHPTWDKAKNHSDTVKLARKWSKMLRRKPKDLASAPKHQVVLARQLDGCRPSSRCWLGGCPRCGRAFQRWAVTNVLTFLDASKGDVFAISLVIPGASAKKGHLRSFEFAQFMERACTALIDTGFVKKAVLGLDISFNDFSQRGCYSRWQMQIYGFCQTSSRKKLREALSKTFPATDTVPRPVRTRKFDGSTKAASYAFKFQSVRRISYRDRTGRWNTKTRRLQAHEHVELMLALSQLGLAGRMAVMGIDNSKMTREPEMY